MLRARPTIPKKQMSPLLTECPKSLLPKALEFASRRLGLRFYRKAEARMANATLMLQLNHARTLDAEALASTTARCNRAMASEQKIRTQLYRLYVIGYGI